MGGDLRERNHLGDPGINERIILRWIFKKWGVGIWAGFILLRVGTRGGNEPSAYIKWGGIS